MRRYILAYDLGTSGNKACLFDCTAGRFVDSAFASYETYYPQSDYAEQDPDAWWDSVKRTTRELMQKTGVPAADVFAISFSAHSLGCVPVDQYGRKVRARTMIWNDARAQSQAKRIAEAYGARRHYEATGNSFDLALYPCAKIMWLKENEPEVYRNTYKFIGTKEYIIHKMTDCLGVTDYTEAGMSGMFHLTRHDYEQELLDIGGIDRDKLCDTVRNTTVVGGLTQRAAEELSLAPGTEVVLGTMDNLACAIGSGGMELGGFTACVGTAGWLGVCSGEPLMSKEFQSNVMYTGDGHYYTSVHSHSACVTYEWVMQNMLPNLEGNYSELERLAASVPPGSDHLFFMPSFQSGNTIYSSTDLAGAYLGLRMQHTQANLIRAAFEGIGFDLMMGADFFKQIGISPSKAFLIGGGANNHLWRTILASMLGCRLTVPKNMRYVGALGAVMIAGVGTGVFSELSKAGQFLEAESTAEPEAEAAARYEALLPVYKSCYEALMPVYERLYQQ